jgi:hypothetical protein
MADEQIIYLSPEEELSNVRERLEKTQAQHIILVIPPQTQLRSHVGWRLVHAHARELGKDVLVISSDRQTRAVVKAAGFRVADSQESPPPGETRPGSRPSRTRAGRKTETRLRSAPDRNTPDDRSSRTDIRSGQREQPAPRDKEPVSSSSFEREREILTRSTNPPEHNHGELETLYQIAQILNSTLEFDELLRLVMDQAIKFTDSERGFIVLVDPKTGRLEFTIARDKQARTIGEGAFEYNISRSSVDNVVKTSKPMLSDNSDDPTKSMMAYDIRSIMCAPLIVRGNCIGAVYVDSRIKANLFNVKDLDLLLGFCDQAAIAIDNAQLFTDLTKTTRAERVSRLKLFAVARAELEENDRALIGKVYSVQTGISQNKLEKFEGEPFDLPVSDIRELLSFDILLHASKNIELLTKWQKHLHYNPLDLEPQLVEFTFRVVAPGPSSLDINFYHERRWLRTIHFAFDAVEQSELSGVLTEE